MLVLKYSESPDASCKDETIVLARRQAVLHSEPTTSAGCMVRKEIKTTSCFTNKEHMYILV
eukprot:113655-Amorphochlora_amoeboformis.AAC.1